MNKRQKETQQVFLDNEKAVLKKLEENYQDALFEINDKIERLLLRKDSDMQNVIYQIEYQKALKAQVETILEQLHANEFETVSAYLTASYEDGFIATMYDLQGQGIPLVIPIDQKQVAIAIQHETKLSEGLYAALGKDTKRLSKQIAAEISRGISAAATYEEMTRNIANFSNIPRNNAARIARTEAHRIQNKATADAQWKAKEKGADVVKQWDSTLDGKTRSTHRQLDGQIMELDEPFEVNGMSAMQPGDFGDPAEDCNCRCALLQRARWALDEKELETLKTRAEYFNLDKSKDFDDFKKKYLKAQESERVRSSVQNMNIIKDSEVKTIDDINKIGKSSLEDAYEYHRTNNNMKSVPLADLGEFSPISANYGNMSVESASVFNDTFKNLIAEYDTPLTKIRTMTKQEALGNTAFATTWHSYSADTAEIIINPMKCKDYDKLTSRIKELSESGYAAKIKPELADQYIATHEFAHSLLNMQEPLKNSTNWVNADYGKLKKARKEISSVYDRYIKEVEELTNTQKQVELELLTDMNPELWDRAVAATEALNNARISKYSMENVDEFLAESFTNERIGEKSNPYAKEVYDIMNKYFKR